MFQKISQLAFSIFVITLATVQANEYKDCVNSENPIGCRGYNFLSKALNQVLANQNDESLKLLPGLEIVQNENINIISHPNDERSMTDETKEPMITRIAKYLQTHDLKIKFADLIGKTDLQEVINTVFSNDDPAVVGKLF